MKLSKESFLEISLLELIQVSPKAFDPLIRFQITPSIFAMLKHPAAGDFIYSTLSVQISPLELRKLLQEQKMLIPDPSA